MKLELDHVVVFVPDLDIGMARFEALGFDVERGGAHGLTENALILFQDGTYIELLALKPTVAGRLMRLAASTGLIGALARRRRDLGWRLFQWICRDYGCVDWCLRTDDLDAALDAWRRDGAAISLGAAPYSRERPDGQVARWRLGSLKDADLPFLLSDLTDRRLRAPPPRREHPNGVTGIRRISLAVDDLGDAARRFDDRFGRAPSDDAAPVYRVQGHEIVLVEAGRHAGKCALALACADPGPAPIAPADAFGMTIDLSPA